jgi:hypothetical protein
LKLGAEYGGESTARADLEGTDEESEGAKVGAGDTVMVKGRIPGYVIFLVIVVASMVRSLVILRPAVEYGLMLLVVLLCEMCI